MLAQVGGPVDGGDKGADGNGNYTPELNNMVTQHIPTMTDSHHGGFLSVMIMVGICQVTNSHHK